MLGLFITQSGSGLSPDSLKYINTAENLYYGNGFFYDKSDSQRPLTQFPPLFPFLIATFMHLGFDAEQAARLIPIICFAFLMFPLFFLAKTLNNVYVGYIVCLMSLIFTPLLFVTSWAWTEMPFIFFSVMSIFFIEKFIEHPEAKTKIIYASGFIALATLTRYIGVTLLFVGFIVVLLKNKSQLKKMAYHTLLIGFIPVFLMTPWLYRNITITSHLSGAERASNYDGTSIIIDFFTNLNLTIGVILNDFFQIPLQELFINKFINLSFSLIIIIFFIILLIFRKQICPHKDFFSEYLMKNYVLLLYVLVYLITLIIISSFWGFDPISTRLTSPTYPFMILLIFSFVLYAHKQIFRPSLKPFLFLITMILFLLFPILQVGNSIYYYEYTKEGEGYNAPYWKNSEGISWIGRNVPDDKTIYSNCASVVQFRLKRQIIDLPYSEDYEAINNLFIKLKNEESSHIIAFNKRNYDKNDLQNYEIREMNKKYNILVEVENSTEYTIYKTKSKIPGN